MEPRCLKKTPFREVPTAQKCCKKQYEIKIFVVRDQNMTKKTPTRQMLITKKDLQKQLKKVKQKQCIDSCPRLKNIVKKQYEIKIFVVRD